MSNTAVLHKILHVKEKEKNDAQVEKVRAVEYFEHIATQLYEELKVKENAETTLQHVMRESSTITTIKEQSLYISMLHKKILALQQKVQAARSEMEKKQVIFTEAHVEVKKIEKLIELRENELKAMEQKQETLLMDEVSIRQFQMQTKNR